MLISTCTMSSAQVKRVDLAGSWYPASKERLHEMLSRYLKQADTPKIEGKPIAIISPHAGYIYSGPVAAYGFRLLKNRNIKTAIVIGFSHRRYFDGIAVFNGDGIETPFGLIKVNKNITGELMNESEKIYSFPDAFKNENSVEMQLPFLQLVLDDFEIVLIAIGYQSYENSKLLGDALYNVLKNKRDFIIIGSTDMSHYLTYESANELDRETINIISKFDPDILYSESLINNHTLMCGIGAVCTTLIAAKKLGADKIHILKYANSGDTSGLVNNVVGYLSAAIIKSQTLKPDYATISKSSMFKKKGGSMFSKEQKNKLLKLARSSIIYYLKNGTYMAVKEEDRLLNKQMGAFVTLQKGGMLRGCIGNIVGRGPLYLTVRDMAVEAAIGDPRFPQVTLEEMKDITIEISVLSPLKKIDNPYDIVLGKHGVMVKNGFRSGVYLPQVATETGWSLEEFMSSLCAHKAGLNPDAWRTGECEIYTFTAEVFGEKE